MDVQIISLMLELIEWVGDFRSRENVFARVNYVIAVFCIHYEEHSTNLMQIEFSALKMLI